MVPRGALAHGKAQTGAALDNAALRTEGRVTLIDGLLAIAVLFGLVLNSAAGWWWADPAAAYVLVSTHLREARKGPHPRLTPPAEPDASRSRLTRPAAP